MIYMLGRHCFFKRRFVSHTARQRFTIEPMEPRILLSADPIVGGPAQMLADQVLANDDVAMASEQIVALNEQTKSTRQRQTHISQEQNSYATAEFVIDMTNPAWQSRYMDHLLAIAPDMEIEVNRRGDITLSTAGHLDLKNAVLAAGEHRLRLQAGGHIFATLDASDISLIADGDVHVSIANAQDSVTLGKIDVSAGHDVTLSATQSTINVTQPIKLTDAGSLDLSAENGLNIQAPMMTDGGDISLQANRIDIAAELPDPLGRADESFFAACLGEMVSQVPGHGAVAAVAMAEAAERAAVAALAD